MKPSLNTERNVSGFCPSIAPSSKAFTAWLYSKLSTLVLTFCKSSIDNLVIANEMQTASSESGNTVTVPNCKFSGSVFNGGVTNLIILGSPGNIAISPYLLINTESLRAK